MMRFLQKHRLASGITLIACLSSGLFILLFNHVEQQHADAVKTQQAKDFAKLDKAVAAHVAQIKQAAAKKRSEESAAQEKEAKDAAEDASNSSKNIPSTTTNSALSHRNPANLDIIVNKKHPLSPLSYTPSVTSVACAGRGATTIAPVMVNDFNALCQAAAEAGVPLDSSSSYRSYATQVSTYNYWVSVSGKKGADTYSARPGYSEHQTGLSIDFRVPGGAMLSDFTGTKQQQWLAANAWRYGFIQRYTSANQNDTGYTAESWHYRYVGRSVASDYHYKNALSLESYWGISGGDYN